MDRFKTANTFHTLNLYASYFEILAWQLQRNEIDYGGPSCLKEGDKNTLNGKFH